MVLQVGMHTWKVSPHLWPSSHLVTNDSSDCSTSGVGFGVVWKSVLALIRQYGLYAISEEMGVNFKRNIFITSVWKMLDASWLWLQLSYFHICHFTVYIPLSR